jgi:hypothetical protein
MNILLGCLNNTPLEQDQLLIAPELIIRGSSSAYHL